MSEHLATKANMDEIIKSIEEEIEVHGTVKVVVTSGKIGKWTMTRLWRSWMGTIAKVMASRGVTMPLMITRNGRCFGKRPFNKNDAHDLFVTQFLGVDENGNRLSFAKKSHDGKRAATKGERFSAMLKVEEFAVERGIKLLQPREGEYFDEKDKGSY